MKSFSRNILIALILLAGYCSNISSQTLIQLQKGQTETYVMSMLILEDETGELDLNSVTSPENWNSFQDFFGDITKLNAENEVSWIKVSIENQSKKDEEWVFDFGANWSRIEFYPYDSTGVNEDQKKITGKLIPFSKRNYPRANQNYILKNLPAEESSNFLVKLDSRGIKSYTFGAKSPAFALLKQSASDQKDSNKKLWIGVFAAIFLFMFVYHLFVYAATWEKSYLYYLGILATYFYMTLSNSGFIVEFLGGIDGFPKYMDTFSIIVSSLMGIIVVLFTRNLLKTAKRLPFWDKVLKVIIALLLVQLVGQFIFNNFISPIIPVIIAVQHIGLLIVGIISLVRKVPSSGYYMVAFIFYFFGVLFFSFTVMGVLPFSEFNFLYAPLIGWALEILFFSFAIANIINVLKNKNEEGQLKYIEKLKENETLQTKVNRELEEKVKERTQEIEKQKELLEVQIQKSNELLLNILPEEIAKELKETGFSPPRHYDNVAVMFTDFKEFSKIAEKLSSKQLVENLDECFKAFDDILTHYNLEKIKTIGDSYMCAGGLPVPSEDSTLRTVEAAMAMNEFINGWNKKKIANNEEPWLMRIGIDTGSITAGIVGKKKFAFDIWGNTVNIASRMESAGETGKINVSKDTWEKVKHKFKAKYRGAIKVKNNQSILMYFLTPE